MRVNLLQVQEALKAFASKPVHTEHGFRALKGITTVQYLFSLILSIKDVKLSL
jgi:hypothetical protein